MSHYCIIGGSSGIGQALVAQLTQAGHRVTATYRSHQPSLSHPLLDHHHLDVIEEEMHMNFLPEVLDGLVYCPGSISLRPFERIKVSDFEEDYRLQVSGAIRCIQQALPRLRKSDHASLVLFSTVAVQTGMPFHTQVAASKGALEGLVRALAAELAPTVRVNAIAPSLTDTPLASALLNTEQKREANAQRHPLKRVGEPEDLAHLAAFLLSTQARWITGQVMHLDGGMSTLKT